MPPLPSGTSQGPTPPETLGPPAQQPLQGAQGHGSAWLPAVPSRSPTWEMPHPAALAGSAGEEQSQLPLLAPVRPGPSPANPVKTDSSSTFPAGHGVPAQGDAPRLLLQPSTSSSSSRRTHSPSVQPAQGVHSCLMGERAGGEGQLGTSCGPAEPLQSWAAETRHP